MHYLWTGEKDRPEDAEDYSDTTLLTANKRLRRGQIIIGNPDAPYDNRLVMPKGEWAEVHTEHNVVDIDHKFWANNQIQKMTGLLTGFGKDTSIDILEAAMSATPPVDIKGFSVLILNGPNLNMLGTREPEIYGNKTLQAIFNELTARHPDLEIKFLQTNSEREIINVIQTAHESFDAIIINAAAYTHTSIAIHDALKNFDDIIIELHISNPHQREEFRHRSFISPVADGIVAGFGTIGYDLALMGVLSKL